MTTAITIYAIGFLVTWFGCILFYGVACSKPETGLTVLHASSMSLMMASMWPLTLAVALPSGVVSWIWELRRKS